ncbi:MAG: alpha-amylase family glycosyl hydrolase, partial [Pseudomonadota bacterium]
PQADYGYDVEDYTDVDPLFGSLEDADQLIERAHARGLKVMVDLVLSHTSERHPWFRESRSNRTNSKADWYVWADPKADGTPPNNWLSIFGGSAWQWEPRRRQYYLHNFLKEQPDLNMYCPEVVPALLDAARFWLDRGVDGFRLDAIDCAVHDQDLRDNPPRSTGERLPGGIVAANPVSMQVQRHNKGLVDTARILLQPLRELCDRYGDVVLLGEIAGDRALENAVAYAAGGRGIHMAYTFDLLAADYDAWAFGDIIDRLERSIEGGWPCWSLSNHDVVRAPTRLGGLGPSEALRRQLPVLLGCLRGSICLYQGEELGLDEAELSFEDLHDPYGITFWPLFKGRDGCRTPMPWTDEAPHAGFSTAKPWLPVPAAHRARTVDDQEADTSSCLNGVRAFLNWRRAQPALVVGDWRRLAAPAGVFAFERGTARQRLLCAFNLTDHTVRWAPPLALEMTDAPLAFSGTLASDGTLTLPGHGCLIARLIDERE